VRMKEFRHENTRKTELSKELARATVWAPREFHQVSSKTLKTGPHQSQKSLRVINEKKKKRKKKKRVPPT